jgi:hypothetical protein
MPSPSLNGAYVRHSDRPSSATRAVSRDPQLHLEDMRDACERISEHRAVRDLHEVPGDPKTRDAIFWNLLILGEAAKQVSNEITERNPDDEFAVLVDDLEDDNAPELVAEGEQAAVHAPSGSEPSPRLRRRLHEG